MKAFSREGFGRQSMSEKRKGHIDPKSSEVYQRAKAYKEHKDPKGRLHYWFVRVVSWSTKHHWFGGGFGVSCSVSLVCDLQECEQL
jgi:hypothetical protein